MLKEQEEKEVQSKEYKNKKLTYDHNGNVLIIKGFNKKGNYDFYNPEQAENITNTINQAQSPNFEDQGITDKRLMVWLEKIKFKNDRKFLEDYLSMSDARKYMKLTDQQRIEEWLSNVPEMI